MNRLLIYLGIKNIGLFELLFASYPIVGGYSYSKVHMSLITLLIMDCYAYFHRKFKINYKPLGWIILFGILHEIILFAVLGFNNETILTNIVFAVLMCGSIYVIAPALNYKKLIASFNLIAIISIVGLVYHIGIINMGGIVTPIKLFFMPTPDTTSRLFEEGIRPVSFFWEPSAFASYMLFPLTLSLIERKYIWTIICIVSCVFSTSTNGIVFSLIVVISYLFTQKIKTKYKLFVLLLGVSIAAFVIYSDLSILEYGKDKITNTDLQETARTSNGPFLLMQMPLNHIIFGFPSNDVFSYVMSHYVSGDNLIYNVEEKTIYVSAFWYLLAKYGLLGFVLYFISYINLIRLDRKIAPYIITLLVATFTQCVVFNAAYVTQFAFIFCIMAHNNTLPIKYNKLKVS